MNEHLAVIAVCVAPDAHGVVVLDGAGWHSSKGLITSANLTLISQPPFAPEVNPVETVWEYLRQNKLAIRTYETYEAIVEAWLVRPGMTYGNAAPHHLACYTPMGRRVMTFDAWYYTRSLNGPASMPFHTLAIVRERTAPAEQKHRQSPIRWRRSVVSIVLLKHHARARRAIHAQGATGLEVLG
jgi:DDE superfamily endonuclease